MIMVNIFEAKAKLSEYVEAVGRGERVVICNRNRPVAELRAIATAPAVRRLGTAAGAVTMSAAFNDPLPDDLLDAFEGRESGGGASRAAEGKGRYSARTRSRRR
ncbi:MAG TPA: type II toxin-antitoxin system prevent-host-death family antitoxin [Vicinamibacterales bacterium]|nr:type II toxin-antitoxin system prevent-host-death family antitoxin [Vicinamibacterales bacterium]